MVLVEGHFLRMDRQGYFTLKGGRAVRLCESGGWAGSMRNAMRLLRPLLTVLLGLLLAFDAVICYRLWHYGLPHELILESAGSGAERVIVKRVPFTVLDGLFLGLFAAFHLGFYYLARRSWKAAGGQATDEFGNKLGPSGKRQVDRTRSNTREAARNKALNEGSGAVEHRIPRQGAPHFHPTNNQGKKKPSSTHYEYPD